MNLSVYIINPVSVRTVAASVFGIVARNISTVTVASGQKIAKHNRLMCESVVIEWRIQ